MNARLYALLAAVGVVGILFTKRDNQMESPVQNDIRSCIVAKAKAEVGQGTWSKYFVPGTAAHPGSRVSWCGVFALWALHQCGVGTHLQWIYGKGFLYKLPRTKSPLPADMAYLDKPYQHHAIVDRVEGDLVYTIDGNQEGDVVAERVRKKSEFSAFYSIEPLLESNLLA